MTVGVIGLGVMGTPIARHLLAAGFAVVGHDIVDEALVCFEAMGGKRARSARNVAGAEWSEGRLVAASRDKDRMKAAANPRGMQGYAAGR